jgi:hypothetical protein
MSWASDILQLIPATCRCKFALNRETAPTCLEIELKRHPWRGSLLVASGKVLHCANVEGRLPFSSQHVSLPRLEVSHGNPAA